VTLFWTKSAISADTPAPGFQGQRSVRRRMKRMKRAIFCRTLYTERNGNPCCVMRPGVAVFSDRVSPDWIVWSPATIGFSKEKDNAHDTLIFHGYL